MHEKYNKKFEISRFTSLEKNIDIRLFEEKN